MKKATIATLALVLVLAASTFASAANYIGGGIGIIPSVSSTAEDGSWIGKLPVFTLALDFDVMDKLSVSANGYIKVVEKVDGVSVTPTSAANYDINYLVGGYAKYALANLDALKLGAVVGANYDSKFLNADAEPAINYGGGVFAEQPLGETGTIFGQVMYWVKAADEAPVTDHIGGLGGINFRITDKIAVKGQIEYVNKQALFSIGVGYTF